MAAWYSVICRKTWILRGKSWIEVYIFPENHMIRSNATNILMVVILGTLRKLETSKEFCGTSGSLEKI